MDIEDKASENKTEFLKNGKWETNIEAIVSELPVLLVRQAYNDILPEEIITSSKRGWDIPKDEWVSQDADYKIFNSRFKQHPNIESWFNINK